MFVNLKEKQPMNENDQKCIAVLCVDHRMHKSTSDFRAKLEEALGTDNIYTICYPGADKLITETCEYAKEGLSAISHIVEQTKNVLTEHGHEHVLKVVVAHATCAGYPVSDKEHIASVRKLADHLTETLDLDVGFTPFMAYKVDSNDDLRWVVEKA